MSKSKKELEVKLMHLYNRSVEISSMLEQSISKMYEIEDKQYHETLQALEGTKRYLNMVLVDELQHLEDGGLMEYVS